jgi:hypothetical protein
LAKGLALIRSPWRLAALAAGVLTLAAASTASADTYTVYSCKGPTGLPNAAAGWAAFPVATGQGAAVNACPSGGALTASLSGASIFGGSSAAWSFNAPANTRIVSLGALRTTSGVSPSVQSKDVSYVLETDGVNLELCDVSVTSSCVSDLNGTIEKQGLNAGTVRFSVLCTTGASSTCSRPLRADFVNARVGLKDASAPTISGVKVLDTGDTSGTLAVTYNAADAGGGVYRAVVNVDGKPAAVQPLGGPDCADAQPADTDPYQFLVPVPCPPAVNGAVTRVNFRTLPAGPHAIEIAVEDAAGNATSVFTTQFPRLNAEGAPSTPAGIQRILHGRLRVWFAKTRNKRLTSIYGQRVVTRGRLLDSRGKPIRGARIDVFHRLRSSGHRRLLKTGLKTRADGRITLILPLNVDTRGIEYDFRAVRPGKITSRQILRLTVKRHGRTFIRKLKSRT